MAKSFEADTLRRGVWPNGKPLTSKDREQLIKTYLPEPRETTQSVYPSEEIRFDHNNELSNRSQDVSRQQASSKLLCQPIGLLKIIFHKLIFFLIQSTFSIYIHGRQIFHAVVDRIFAILYYHHRTPELIQRDTRLLGKLPRHLSLIVELPIKGTGNDTETEGLLKLCGEVAEISAWCACTGIHMISIYEQTGVLKSHMPFLHQALEDTFQSYFSPGLVQPFNLHAPNRSVFSPPKTSFKSPGKTQPLKVLLLSASDGRDTLVDLTKTLVEMSQEGKISSSDISADLVDTELRESSCSEPDLLAIMAPSSYKIYSYSIFSGFKGTRRISQGASTRDIHVFDDLHRYRSRAEGELCLRGYPPWQLRLTEIFHVPDNSGVGYQLFLRALHRYAKSQMRFGPFLEKRFAAKDIWLKVSASQPATDVPVTMTSIPPRPQQFSKEQKQALSSL